MSQNGTAGDVFYSPLLPAMWPVIREEAVLKGREQRKTELGTKTDIDSGSTKRTADIAFPSQVSQNTIALSMRNVRRNLLARSLLFTSAMLAES
ncbi:hypothetical protein BaRGS_00019436 [Batillaria attramentaria]|uniref:Uncharacterized protein n=1 Tax=Batillaria attramentaria TaxID=370345 RepID=A0ABD0KQY1_9CAEN